MEVTTVPPPSLSIDVGIHHHHITFCVPLSEQHGNAVPMQAACLWRFSCRQSRLDKTAASHPHPPGSSNQRTNRRLHCIRGVRAGQTCICISCRYCCLGTPYTLSNKLLPFLSPVINAQTPELSSRGIKKRTDEAFPPSPLAYIPYHLLLLRSSYYGVRNTYIHVIILHGQWLVIGNVYTATPGT